MIKKCWKISKGWKRFLCYCKKSNWGYRVADIFGKDANLYKLLFGILNSCYVMSAIELLTYAIENVLWKTYGIALQAAGKQTRDANAKEQTWTKHVNVRNLMFIVPASITGSESAKIRSLCQEVSPVARVLT